MGLGVFCTWGIAGEGILFPAGGDLVAGWISGFEAVCTCGLMTIVASKLISRADDLFFIEALLPVALLELLGSVVLSAFPLDKSLNDEPQPGQ